MKYSRKSRAKLKTKERIVITTVLITVVLLSTSAWIITSKAEEQAKNNVTLASKEVALPAVSKQNSVNTIAYKQEVVPKKLLRIEKLANELDAKKSKLKAAEVKKEKDRLANIAADILKQEEAETIRLAEIAADNAKQEEIDRIAANKANKAKIDAAYKIAKAASDKAEQDKIDKLVKIETERLAKVEEKRLAKIEVDRVAKIEADRLAKIEVDRLAQIEADRLAQIEEDRLAKVEAERLAQIEADRIEVEDEDARQAKIEAERLAKIEAEKSAKIESEKSAKIELERLDKIEIERLAKIRADKIDKVEIDRLAKIDLERLKGLGFQQTANGAKLSAYLRSEINVSITLNEAVRLHKLYLPGDPNPNGNNCVYFSSQAMRNIGVNVPSTMCNTKGYLQYLRNHEWEPSYEIKNLTPGSIAFTTNTGAGYPTHTFVFMGWVNTGNYTLAYVADNQGNEVHVRNMGATSETDAFAFFMHN
ncbi:hypothetical protein [Clostridium sp.]|jgi:hypothetical protein|uniref:hypothetical protein n=1 Tax=Clostridium sp. TaxID=1506 RepID=UPI003EEE8D01